MTDMEQGYEGELQCAIRLESADDRDAIRRVNQAAFRGDDEANLVDALRDGGFVASSLVAEIDGHVVAHILFSNVKIVTNSGTVAALSLAPMAVLPGYQRRGIGTRLLSDGLTDCRNAGHEIVLVLGHPQFYQKFGFLPELAQPIASPFGGGVEWMALELQPCSLNGIAGRVEFSPPFGAFE